MQEVVIDNDDDDEFEPLFSYQRVCRPPSDDDSDEDVTIIDGKAWQSAIKHGGGNALSSSVLKSKGSVGKRIHEDLDKEIEDDDDWLPPPPKAAKTFLGSKVNEDPTLREIRQKREELMQLTASSEAALRKLEEDRRAQNSASNKLESTPALAHQQVSAAGKREKVLVCIQNKDGVCKTFRVFKDEKFEKLFSTYAESISTLPTQLVFIFDGQQILGHNTPKDLDIEDEDIIEVNLRT